MKIEKWPAQSWLFRELLCKMKKNNVERVFMITEDKEGNQISFTHNFKTDKYLKKTFSSLV